MSTAPAPSRAPAGTPRLLASSWPPVTVEAVSAPTPARPAQQQPLRPDRAASYALPTTPTAAREIAAWDGPPGETDRATMSVYSAFISQIGAYPQLTGPAQNELVAAYQHSLLVQGWLDGGQVPSRLKARARRATQVGQRHLDTVVGANFRLLLVIAKEHALAKHGPARLNDELPDLVAEGAVALSEAAKIFDPAQVTLFPTFAALRVRNAVRAALTRTAPLKVEPSWERVRRIAHKRKAALEEQLGRAPSMDELAEATRAYCYQWAESKLSERDRALPEQARRAKIEYKLRKQGTLGAIENLSQVMQAPRSTVSLDTPVGEDGDTTLGEIAVSHDPTPGVVDGLTRHELHGDLMLALGQLDDRERRILMLRYGLAPECDGVGWTYAQIATQFGRTPERIRQIESAVLKRLNSPHVHYGRLAAHLPTQIERD